MRDFAEWLDKMRPSINGYDYYVDFDKVRTNANAIKVELNILNALIGSDNVEQEMRELIAKYPEVLKTIPTLLAVRQEEIYAQNEEGARIYNFKNIDKSDLEQYIYFMKETGLLELISKHLINNLFDYVLGIETGLDSNARKNRGGHQMEDLVESFIKKADVEYYKEMYLTEIESKWGVDLSAISAEGTTTKRWDFVVKTDECIYVIETNFYGAGGSKLNETSRSYKMIAEEAREVSGVKFVWITDGGGWRSARRNLEETFNTMEHLYNIADMEDGVFLSLFK